MSEWRPVETAPRDGTLVEVMDPDCGRFVMQWNPVDTHKWFPQNSLEPRCSDCGCLLIIPYGDIDERAVTPCPGASASALPDDRSAIDANEVAR